jgi:predicted CXXCH cytochrome family protein
MSRIRQFTALSLLLLATACTDTETVYVETPMFNTPVDTVNGFLGLFKVSTNQTACGNCHAGTQRQWVTTAHAEAYEGLVGNVANPDPSCFGCHTVSQNGNPIALTGNPGGWNLFEDSTYHNVQCESCHGPGFEHAQSPDNQVNAPLARIGVRDTAASCAGCHSGTHQPFVEQWAQSGHADSAGMASPGTNSSCVGCHEGRAAIRRFSGQASNFVELTYPVADNQTITCAVCHDPHGSPNTAQLRAPINSQDIGVNLCMQCHNRNSTPTASYTVGSRGAHSSQGGVYLGQGAGWYPPGFAVDTSLIYQTTHLGGNPRLCAGCHVAKFDVTDPATGAFVFSSTGHLFSPNPCLDASGIPNANNDCAYTTAARSWAGCTTSGCHTATAAAALFNSLKGEVDFLVNVLWQDLNGNHTLDPSPTDGGYLAIIRANYPGNNTAAFCCTGAPSDNRLSVAEGALFNAQMLGAGLYDHRDGSHGVHNSAFYKAILAATIASLQATYTLPPASNAVAEAMSQALNHPAVRYTPAVRATAAR